LSENFQKQRPGNHYESDWRRSWAWLDRFSEGKTTSPSPAVYVPRIRGFQWHGRDAAPAHLGRFARPKAGRDPQKFLRFGSNQLSVTVYDVFDPPSPAPANILEIEFQNPALPAEDDSTWAESGGHEFPLSAGIEWMQALDPSQEYEQENMVGCTGWVVTPDYSGADAPFDHPFGFDWEFQVALDDDKNEYPELLSPGIGQLLASEQGLPMRRGLLGVEWDGNLIPLSFKARVRHGDRVAAFGRWILDSGHNFVKFWRTEIHPPLLLVSANVEKLLARRSRPGRCSCRGRIFPGSTMRSIRPTCTWTRSTMTGLSCCTW